MLFNYIDVYEEKLFVEYVKNPHHWSNFIPHNSN